MLTRIATVAALAWTATAGAQTALPSTLYPPLTEVPGGWAWYLINNSVRTVPGTTSRTYQFWMRGVNNGTGVRRAAMARIQLSCAARTWVQLRLSSFDAAGTAVFTASNGDDPSYWRSIVAGHPTEAAHMRLCR